jgi:hypothetical protein
VAHCSLCATVTAWYSIRNNCYCLVQYTEQLLLPGTVYWKTVTAWYSIMNNCYCLVQYTEQEVITDVLNVQYKLQWLLFNTKQLIFSMSMHFSVHSATLSNSHAMFISLNLCHYHLSCPHTVITIYQAIPYLRWSVTSLTPWRPRFNSMMVFTGFVVGKVAMGQVSVTVLQSSSANNCVTNALRSCIIRGWHNMPHDHPTATGNM